MRDEDSQEIRLKGKQLVFLFMTATVLAVAIFLSGVMVGRGLRVQQIALEEAVNDFPADPTVVAQMPTASTAEAVTGAPLSSQENLSYPDRLSGQDQMVEALISAAPQPDSIALESPVASLPAPAPTAEAPEPVPPLATPVTDDAGQGPDNEGFVVQVAALRDQDDADTMARQLTAKGYPAFVTTSSDGPARFFRVRVGRYDSRREAESVAARLLKEEQFKPWITR